MSTRRLEYVPLDDLTPADRNAKGHAPEVIAASIGRFGYMEPVILDERTGQLVAGHGRREDLIARRDAGEDAPDGVRVRAGAWLVPVVRGWSSTDDAEAMAAGIALNRTVEAGGWDRDELASMLSDLADAPAGFEGVGFDQSYLDDLLHRQEIERRQQEMNDVDDVPRPPSKPVTQLGDVWVMRDHRVICADATSAEAYERVLEGDKIDFVFTSPPFNVGVLYSDDEDDDAVDFDQYRHMLNAVAGNCWEYLADGRMLGWNTGVSPKTAPHRQLALLEDAGFTFRRQLVWRKAGVSVPLWHHTLSNPVARRYIPNYVHELIYLVSKGKQKWGARIEVDERVQNDVFELAQMAATRDLWSDGSTALGGVPGNKGTLEHGHARGKVHPAPFPVALPEMFATHLSDRGAVVFDPFMGSGSTMLAAHRLGRRGVGVELSPAYCDVIAERFQRVVGDVPILCRTGRPDRPIDFAKRRAKG